ncbi:ComEC/Rec2 family competence protein [Qipengyuania atrilutea]|uniref:ComEC/Rec2 family competence protein n=1 Tax=Qipengyuania atrilutea TaxID=2744473 RepID=UPI001CEC0DDC|nr:ComEC/Rec2 family competence protein [Actirhodobacter atriluteus]
MIARAMGVHATFDFPAPETEFGSEDVRLRTWRGRGALSSVVGAGEAFLGAAGLDKGPWLAAAFASGIGLWFLLADPWQWVAVLGTLAFMGVGALALWRGVVERASLLVAVLSMNAMAGAGMLTIWTRSETVGTEPVEYPRVEWLDARILEREERPAEERIRLVLAARDAATASAIKVRVNVPIADDRERLNEGARIRLRTRLMPPAAPMLPGAYDFARVAWFDGLAATGTLIGDIEIVAPAHASDTIPALQRYLSDHVRSKLDGSAGSIAAAFASGDRGAISQADEEAMRDAGLTHLLSISGLHVSAIIAAAYFLVMKLLALSPWLALRIRLPLAAAGAAALAGIGYTLLTGAEVPTVRSCIGALLVLIALALGREPLSLRMVAVAALCVMVAWPETLVTPSFQMSFSAVIAIVALHGCAPVRAFLAPREESGPRWLARRVAMLFATGLVIEIALMPIVLFHFHRAGFYGAFANVFAIPLTTFVSMPLIAIALLLDCVGLGGPVWWLAGKSLDLLIGIARFVSAQPGAVKLVPQMTMATVMLFVSGALWVALWRGKARLYGFVPAALGALLFAGTSTPDVLIDRDGRHVGIAGEDQRLLLLRDSRSSYARDNLLELAGMEGEPIALADWPDARCNDDFCTIALRRGGRDWHLLLARSDNLVSERALAAACAQSTS